MSQPMFHLQLLVFIDEHNTAHLLCSRCLGCATQPFLPAPSASMQSRHCVPIVKVQRKRTPALLEVQPTLLGRLEQALWEPALGG